MSSHRRQTTPFILKLAAPVILAAIVLVAAMQHFSSPNAKPAIALDPSCPLSVVMLDVGQGDSILLASGGQYALVDAGENDRGDDVVADLKGYGVTRLAAVIGTHPHSDHVGGLDTVLDDMPADRLYLSPRTADTETYEDVLDAAERKGMKATIPKPGDTLKLGEAEITFLWPADGYESDNANDWSLVMMVRAAGHSALLTGDIEKDAERALLDGGMSLDCDVLKVAHHGSDTSSTTAFLQAASPELALISVGAGNDYGHPDGDALKRLTDAGAKCYRTDQCGTVIVQFTHDGISVIKEK